MSRGQKPRWKSYFPRMKERGRHRKRGVRITVFDEKWNAIWPPVPVADGQAVRIDQGTVAFNGRWFDKRTGYWMDQEEGSTP